MRKIHSLPLFFVSVFTSLLQLHLGTLQSLMRCSLETIQDFLVQVGHKHFFVIYICIFSSSDLPKLSTEPTKVWRIFRKCSMYWKNQILKKKLNKKSWTVSNLGLVKPVCIRRFTSDLKQQPFNNCFIDFKSGIGFFWQIFFINRMSSFTHVFSQGLLLISSFFQTIWMVLV